VRTQQLAGIAAEFKNPAALASRTLNPALFGKAFPYAFPPTGTGDPAVVKTLSRAALAAFHARWFRPDTAKIFVVGDTTLDQVVTMLDGSFGSWKANRMARPVKDFAAAIPPAKARVILVDRPGSPQSYIMGGKVLDAKGTDDLLALNTANDVLGGNFLGRINMNLREDKGWSYGTYNGVTEPLDRISFRVIAPVQTDRTGEAIAEVRKEIAAFTGTNGVKAEELDWSTKGSARELPGMFETSAAVLDGMAKIVTYGRPDDYYETLAARYGEMTTAEADKAFRDKITGDGMVWVVVGDAAKVKAQLSGLGLPVEDVAAPQ
jgi:predicted Zn-dependent peptidase